jgi:hypothetical protein
MPLHHDVEQHIIHVTGLYHRFRRKGGLHTPSNAHLVHRKDHCAGLTIRVQPYASSCHSFHEESPDHVSHQFHPFAHQQALVRVLYM